MLGHERRRARGSHGKGDGNRQGKAMTAAVHKIPGRGRTWPAWRCAATTPASDACIAAPCPMAPRPLGANACPATLRLR
ncbi:hypothetical protein XAR_1903 [Xanthomonas citri pv. glycines str. 8ra]|nr:hypothetical protein XAR_1903 [Xanthomonas citri pv. glycines str. 8ra]